MVKIALVVTTIGDGNFLQSYINAAEAEGLIEDVKFIVIPDLKTPKKLFEICENAKRIGINIVCPTVEDQDLYLTKLGNIKYVIPYNSDNRRNIGFLMAIEDGCDIIVSIDDDNLPRGGELFFKEHLVVNREVKMEAVNSDNGWFNICDLLDVEPKVTYPRGFPYRYRYAVPKIEYDIEEGIVHVNVGLWLGHPDVDAISCLNGPIKSISFRGKSVLLGKYTWSPINTQNTALSKDAVSAFYFWRMGYPIWGISIDRTGDIFSGYFVQACVKHLGYRIRVGTPICNHIRNEHNYLKDLTSELPGIWVLEDITEWLRDIKLEGSTYAEAYMCLADLLEDQVERFSGFIWNDSTRGYFHYIAYCMRTWVKTVKKITGER